MKYFFALALALVCLVSPLTAQNAKVQDLLNKSEATALTMEELAEGKELVDAAIKNNSVNKKPQTWYQRARMYGLIYRSNNNIPGLKKTYSLEQVYEAHNKTLELAEETDPVVPLIKYERQNLWNAVLNQGIEQYQKSNFTSALKYFERTSILRPKDTLGYMYAAQVAGEAQQYDAVVRNYKSLVQLSPKLDYYLYIISMEMNYSEDYDAALKTLKEAKAIYGEDRYELNAYEIDLLIRTNKIQEAMIQLENEIQKAPNKDVLHLRKGLLLDQLRSNEKREASPDYNKLDKLAADAIEAYEKTIELNPRQNVAYFNLAAILSDQGNEFFQAANELSMEEYKTSGPELDPEDITTLRALKGFYIRLDMANELAEIQTKLKALGY